MFISRNIASYCITVTQSSMFCTNISFHVKVFQKETLWENIPEDFLPLQSQKYYLSLPQSIYLPACWPDDFHLDCQQGPALKNLILTLLNLLEHILGILPQLQEGWAPECNPKELKSYIKQWSCKKRPLSETLAAVVTWKLYHTFASNNQNIW